MQLLDHNLIQLVHHVGMGQDLRPLSQQVFFFILRFNPVQASQTNCLASLGIPGYHLTSSRGLHLGSLGGILQVQFHVCPGRHHLPGPGGALRAPHAMCPMESPHSHPAKRVFVVVLKLASTCRGFEVIPSESDEFVRLD